MNKKKQPSIDGEIETSIRTKTGDGTEEGSSSTSRTLSLSKSSQRDNVNSDKEGG